MDVVVIGGGVIGLSTAILLRESGFDANIVAAAPVSETTSAVAAAIWCPYKAQPEDRILGWGKRAFEVFEELSHNPETGIHMREGIELHYEPAPEPFWASAVPGVRRCETDELPLGRRGGHVFTVPVIETPIYLRYLARRFENSGGSIERRTVASLDDVAEEAAVIVNCTGLGSRELVGDESTHPIRGQVLRVCNPGLTRFILDDENPEGVTYIIPRSEDCILGGTAEENVWGTVPDPRVAEGILRRCEKLEPRLAGAEVLEHRVGLRPGRPEVRLELERLYGGLPCIHNYGHGGSGGNALLGMCGRDGWVGSASFEDGDVSGKMPHDSPSQDQTVVREHLANERTLLAWIRTGVAQISIGLVVERAGALVKGETVQFGPVNGSELFGLALVFLGVLTLLIGTAQFIRTRRRISTGDFVSTAAAYLVIVVGSLAFAGAFLVYVIFT